MKENRKYLEAPPRENDFYLIERYNAKKIFQELVQSANQGLEKISQQSLAAATQYAQQGFRTSDGLLQNEYYGVAQEYFDLSLQAALALATQDESQKWEEQLASRGFNAKEGLQEFIQSEQNRTYSGAQKIPVQSGDEDQAIVVIKGLLASPAFFQQGLQHLYTLAPTAAVLRFYNWTANTYAAQLKNMSYTDDFKRFRAQARSEYGKSLEK